MSPSPSRQPLLPVVEGGKMSSAGRLSWQSEGGKRMATFAAAIVVALASGSNYGFSAYAPQLASKLHLSSTQINMVGLAGNFGVYLTGPLWGKMVDAKGPRLALMLGGCFAFTGYAIVHAFYMGTIPIRPADAAKSDPVSSFNFLLLGIAMFITGNGGSAGLFAAVNATAKSFPDKTRASATGTVLSGFGLSAFFFSAVGHLVSGGDAGGLLLLLTFGTGLPIFIASFIVQPVPPFNSDYRAVDGEDQDAGPESSLLMDREDTHESNTGPRVTSLDLARSRSPVPLPRGRLHLPHLDEEDGALQQPKTHTRSTSLASVSPLHLAYTPRDLAMSVDFWTLFTILAVLCGTGLMYINNAGTVALALARDGKVEYDVKVVSAWQAKQVGTVSVWNCAGRILGGIFSDFCKTRFKMQRIWFLPIVAFGFVVSQAAAISTTQVQHLWIVSTLLGLSYGSLFNVLPMLVLEWFGMKHFSQNYGWMCIAPVIGGNIFNILFGRVYDSNTVGRIGDQVEEALNVVRSLVARAGSGVPDGSVHDCLIGTACYSSAFKLSLLACTAAFILSIIAGVRRERLRKTAKRNLRSSVSEPSVTS